MDVKKEQSITIGPVGQYIIKQNKEQRLQIINLLDESIDMANTEKHPWSFYIPDSDSKQKIIINYRQGDIFIYGQIFDQENEISDDRIVIRDMPSSVITNLLQKIEEDILQVRDLVSFLPEDTRKIDDSYQSTKGQVFRTHPWSDETSSFKPWEAVKGD